MKSITVYYLKVNEVDCRLYWSEVGGIESMITGLSRVEYSSKDEYYNRDHIYGDNTLEEWITMEVIEGSTGGKWVDDFDNVVVVLKVIKEENYYIEE